MRVQNILYTLSVMLLIPFSSLKADKLPLLPVNITAEFGPFFIPDTSYVNGMYIVYFTRVPQTTSLSFGIAGDMDWGRTDYTLTKTHSMHFSELEEGMAYKFEIQGQYEHLQYRSLINTKPYGKQYEFSFGVANIDRLNKFEQNPHIMFLLSEHDSLNMKQWQVAVEQNPRFYASSIIIPLFNFNDNESIPYHIEDVDMIEYKDSRFIVIRHEGVEINKISRFIHEDPEVLNYIICNNISPEKLDAVLKQYAFVIDGCFGNIEFEHTLYTRVDQPFVKKVLKDGKKKFALK